MSAVHLDSFSGAAADLPKGRRTERDVLAVLADHPRVSTWDMSEYLWLSDVIGDLRKQGLVESLPEPFPWMRYALTDAGRAALTGKAGKE